MDVDKINERLELALKPAKPPTLGRRLNKFLGAAFCGTGGLGVPGLDVVR
jgi:anaerobic glycerol-3-phosphate dehydrogenase